MNCWEKLRHGTADEVDKTMCAARTVAVMKEIDKVCLEFSESINSLIKEHQEECQFANFNAIFFVTDERVDDNQPLIQFVYGTKDKLQELCTMAQEAIK